jgi:hypothetical protein
VSVWQDNNAGGRFLCTGEWVAFEPGLLDRIKREGHPSADLVEAAVSLRIGVVPPPPQVSRRVPSTMSMSSLARRSTSPVA